MEQMILRWAEVQPDHPGKIVFVISDGCGFPWNRRRPKAGRKYERAVLIVFGPGQALLFPEGQLGWYKREIDQRGLGCVVVPTT